jgi:hypothetical protein
MPLNPPKKRRTWGEMIFGSTMEERGLDPNDPKNQGGLMNRPLPSINLRVDSNANVRRRLATRSSGAAQSPKPTPLSRPSAEFNPQRPDPRPDLAEGTTTPGPEQAPPSAFQQQPSPEQQAHRPSLNQRPPTRGTMDAGPMFDPQVTDALMAAQARWSPPDPNADIAAGIQPAVDQATAAAQQAQQTAQQQMVGPDADRARYIAAGGMPVANIDANTTDLRGRLNMMPDIAAGNQININPTDPRSVAMGEQLRGTGARLNYARPPSEAYQRSMDEMRARQMTPEAAGQRLNQSEQAMDATQARITPEQQKARVEAAKAAAMERHNQTATGQAKQAIDGDRAAYFRDRQPGESVARFQARQQWEQMDQAARQRVTQAATGGQPTGQPGGQPQSTGPLVVNSRQDFNPDGQKHGQKIVVRQPVQDPNRPDQPAQRFFVWNEQTNELMAPDEWDEYVRFIGGGGKQPSRRS